MKLKLLLVALLFSVFSNVLNGQKKNKILDVEKIYLHSDRSTYIVGESLWYKAYSVYAYNNVLFNKSNVLYVELISPDSEIVLRNKTILENGLAHGDFELKASDDIKPGIYLLRAYTNWNRNFGDDFIFEKKIEILNIFKNAKTEDNKKGTKTKNTNYTLDNSKKSFSVQFFPEGGSLLENVASVVAFKAVDLNGKPIRVKGEILDDTGKIVSSLYSVHDGMGKFVFKPKKGTKYHAKITAINSDEIKISLPKPNTEGYLISMQKLKEKNIVTIKTNEQTLLNKPNSPVTLHCTLKGVSYFEGTQPLNSTSLSFELSTNNFPEGIYQLTLYDADLKPQSERLKYISKHNNLDVKLSTDKKTYKPKEKVTVSLYSKFKSGKVPLASYSISSTDLNGLEKVKDYSTNISSYFLMESDIKGNVYNSGYYFDKDNPKRFTNLDLLLLTQGWRDFLWKKKPTLKDTLKFEAEKGLYISGFVKSLFGNKRREDYTINLALTSVKNSKTVFLNTKTDSLGRFKFEDMFFTGDMIMMLNSQNEKGKNRGMLVLDSLNSPMKINYKKSDFYTHESDQKNILKEKIYNKYINFGIAPENILDEIEITSTKKENVPESLYGVADNTFIADEKTARFSTIFQLIQFSIPGITTVGDNISFNRYNGTPLIYVDGVEWSSGDIGSMQPDDVAKVEAFTGAGVSMFGSRGGNGVLIIYTKEGNTENNSSTVYNSITKKIEGFYIARVFYNQDLEKKENDFEVDKSNAIRNTLYWNPYFHIAENGVATTTYLNSEVETTVQVSLEGLTTDGIPIVLKTFYTIKK